MKTEEDEAFDDLAKRQGAWGGGFQAKRRMAADKLQDGKCKYCVDGCAACDARAQPAQDVDYWIREATAARQAEMAMRRELEAQPQPAKKPVAWRWGIKKLNGGYEWRYTLYKTQDDSVPLYAAPPQRPWVGLTDDALADIWYKGSLDWMEFARAHEAALKEKNFD
jgi:hypothetical protein